MRKIKNKNLKNATFLCCEKCSNLVNKKEKCSFCKHLTPAHLKCSKKYKLMRFLSAATSSLHVRRLIRSFYEVIACPIICNQFDLSPTYSVIVNNFSVSFVLRYLTSLGKGAVAYTMLRRPTPGLCRHLFPFRL